MGGNQCINPREIIRNGKNWIKTLFSVKTNLIHADQKVVGQEEGQAQDLHFFNYSNILQKETFEIGGEKKSSHALF